MSEKLSMTNDDFRQMMMTPRSSASSTFSGYHTLPSSSDNDYRPRKKKPRNEKKGKEKALEVEEKGSGYRDRAKERREGINTDYEETELELVTSFSSVPHPDQQDKEKDSIKLSIEKSKYLGGDMEHTHLVKGLDYALLNKVKSELNQKEKQTEVEKTQEKRKKAPKEGPVFRSDLGKRIFAFATKKPEKKTIIDLFVGGRMSFVFDLEPDFPSEIPTTLLHSKVECPKTDELVQGKLHPELFSRIERIVSYIRQGKSKKKLKKKEKQNASKPESQKAQQIMGPPPPQPPQPQKLLQPQSQPQPVVAQSVPSSLTTVGDVVSSPPNIEMDDGDDIFEGAGNEYTCLPKKDQNTKKGAFSYFAVPSNLDDEVSRDASELNKIQDQLPSAPVSSKKRPLLDTPAPPSTALWSGDISKKMGPPLPVTKSNVPQDSTDPAQQQIAVTTDNSKPDSDKFPTQEEKDRGLASVFRRDDNRLRTRRETDIREKEASFVSDNYSECYPGAYETSFTHDSDEEEDLTKMDMGSKKKRLRRWDFETEEAWKAYNDSKEALPRAAFQFGVKMSDGRKTRRTKKAKEVKLTRDLNKINQIMKKWEKKDDGGADHDRGSPSPSP